MKSDLIQQLSLFPELTLAEKRAQVVNVASVPQRSPFRYPGGKTWLVPTARKWFKQASKNDVLYEPFAGGGIISLTAVAEQYFKKAVMVELDDDMAAAWKTMLSEEDCEWLIKSICSFEVSPDNINEVLRQSMIGTKEHGFATIVRNRTNHGGILAKGSGMIKTGEGGRGLSSRWYPSTLVKRIRDVYALRERITFVHGDAFEQMENQLHSTNAFFFIDPPYTIAGRRLYNLYDVDHFKIFELASHMKGHFLLTYDDTEEIRSLANDFDMPYQTIPMQTTHLITKEELLISDNFDWI